MERLCVFCGSSAGARPDYVAAAAAFGQLLARRGIGLVFGGGRRGLMGALADACLEEGGQVTGVIPAHLWDRELGHTAVADMRVVSSMHERKALMAELADAFVALPGGVGTMEEFFEVWTWGQLGLHAKPYGLLNASGYFDPLIQFLDHMVEEGFLPAQHRAVVLVEREPATLLERLTTFRPPAPEAKWLNPSET